MRVSVVNGWFRGTLLVLTALLVACGGGGGGGGSGAGNTPSPTNAYAVTCVDGTTKTSAVSQADAQAQCPSPTTSTIVKAALPVASTYAAQGLTEEQAAFDLLNQERSRCGFGTLAQNAVLDKAAQNHAQWQVLNTYLDHTEIQGTPGFTGVNEVARINAVGGYGVVGNSSDDLTSVVDGAAAVRGLLNAPFHMVGLLGSFRDIGISINKGMWIDEAKKLRTLSVGQFDLAYTKAAGGQLPASAEVLTYPCEGTTGVERQLTNETPNPVPGRNLAVNPLGVSVLVQLRAGNTLTLTSTSMIQLSNGAAVTLRAPVVGFFGTPASAYVAADAPLLPNTAYQVTLRGTNNGTPFSRTFTFSTGN